MRSSGQADAPVPHQGWSERLQRRVMRGLARLPLPWLRALGWLLGMVLYAVVWRRRRVALVNWRLCFPGLSEQRRRQQVRAHFVVFAQAWLDRAWLWEAPAHVVAGRLRLVDDAGTLAQGTPVVLFAPHFVGLDAGWTALTLLQPRRCCVLYAPQKNPVADRWMVEGRNRFGQPLVVAKWQGMKALGTAIREGSPMYLLPDMDHGLADGVWAPLFGVPAATLTSLPRLARLGRAQVLSVATCMTPQGYDVTLGPVWPNYPSNDLHADVCRMNQALEQLIQDMPEQYYWVHQRFKTRPPGEASPYTR